MALCSDSDQGCQNRQNTGTNILEIIYINVVVHVVLGLHAWCMVGLVGVVGGGKKQGNVAKSLEVRHLVTLAETV
jgi:hypothetical protein